jgi:hypothetical protein
MNVIINRRVSFQALSYFSSLSDKVVFVMILHPNVSRNCLDEQIFEFRKHFNSIKSSGYKPNSVIEIRKTRLSKFPVLYFSTS